MATENTRHIVITAVIIWIVSFISAYLQALDKVCATLKAVIAVICLFTVRGHVKLS